MADQLQLGIGFVGGRRASAQVAAHIDGAAHHARRRGHAGLGPRDVRCQLFLDFGTGAAQLGPGRRTAAFAERHMHALVHRLVQHDAAAQRVQAHDRAHARTHIDAAAVRRVGVQRQRQQRVAHAADGGLGIHLQLHIQGLHQHVQRRAAVQSQDHMVTRLGDLHRRGNGLAALHHAREGVHLVGKRHARQSAGQQTGVMGHRQLAAPGQLDAAAPVGAEAPHHLATGGVRSQLQQQLFQLGHAPVAVHQHAVHLETFHLDPGNRLQAGELAEVRRAQQRQHHGQGPLLAGVAHVAAQNGRGRHAAPVADFGQFLGDCGQDVRRMRGIGGGQIHQAQCGPGLARLHGHLRPQLCHHLGQRLLPLGVAGMGTGKKRHGVRPCP